jgi:hypothetical protein
VAQGPDGTIYVVEVPVIGHHWNRPMGEWDKHVLLLDGATGAVKGRVPLPRTTRRSSQPHGRTDYQFETPAGAPSVGEDGAAYLQVYSTASEEETADYSVYGYVSRARLELLRIEPTGAYTVTPLWQCESSETLDCMQGVEPGAVVPDGIGGVLAQWTRDSESAHVTRVVGSTTTEHVLPSLETTIDSVGQDGNVYLELMGTPVGQPMPRHSHRIGRLPAWVNS